MVKLQSNRKEDGHGRFDSRNLISLLVFFLDSIESNREGEQEKWPGHGSSKIESDVSTRPLDKKKKKQPRRTRWSFPLFRRDASGRSVRPSVFLSVENLDSQFGKFKYIEQRHACTQKPSLFVSFICSLFLFLSIHLSEDLKERSGYLKRYV